MSVKIISPSATLLRPELLGEAFGTIERCARVSHDSVSSNSWEDTLRFIRAVVIDHGDWSVVEHVSCSVQFIVDRGISHEIVRHRLASYTQASTRFINYAKGHEPFFIYPKAYTDENKTPDPEWLKAIEMAESSYRTLLGKGWRPQEARSVFPNALATNLIMTCNLRNWRHFLLMRTTKETHPQLKEVTIPLLRNFQSHVSLLFADIEPDARQIENLKKGH